MSMILRRFQWFRIILWIRYGIRYEFFPFISNEIMFLFLSASIRTFPGKHESIAFQHEFQWTLLRKSLATKWFRISFCNVNELNALNTFMPEYLTFGMKNKLENVEKQKQEVHWK